MRDVRTVVVALAILLGGCASDVRYEALKLESPALAAELAGKQPAAPAPKDTALPDSATQAPPEAPAAGQRIVIYRGALELVVSDVARTLEVIRAQALAAGGYLQEMDNTSITVRVPAARFQDLVQWVSRQGELTQKRIQTQDVTDAMRDLRIRLENAEQTRTRLLALLDKSVKMEDTLKIETELERVTGEIELLKGRLLAMSQEVAFSTLRVGLNSPLPQKQLVAQIPFEWVRQLGRGVLSPTASQEAESSWRERRRICFEPPKSYIRYFDRDRTSEAMSADGVIIKVQIHDNYKGGDLAFWSGLARRVMVESRSVAIDRDQLIRISDRGEARLLCGTRDVGGEKSAWLLAVAVSEETVYAFEAWGPAAAFEKDRAAIEASVRSLQPD